MNTAIRLPKLATLLALLSLGSLSAPAATYTWNVTTAYDQRGFKTDSAANWLVDGSTATSAPTADDDLVFEAFAPEVEGNATWNNVRTWVRFNQPGLFNSITFGANAQGSFTINNLVTSANGNLHFTNGFTLNNYNAYTHVISGINTSGYATAYLDGQFNANIEQGGVELKINLADGTGSGSIVKTGAGVLSFVSQGNLQVAASFSGGIRIEEGTVKFTFANAYAGAGALTLDGGTLELASAAAANYANNIAVTANSTLTLDRADAGNGFAVGMASLSIGDQTLHVAKGANVTGGTATLTFNGTPSTVTGNAVFDIDAGVYLQIGNNSSNPLTGAAGTGVTKIGAGVLHLYQAPDFLGDITVKAGEFVLQGNFGASANERGCATLTLDGGLFRTNTIDNGRTHYADLAVTAAGGALFFADLTSIGNTLFHGNLTIAAGATLAINGGNFTRIANDVAENTVTIGAGVTLGILASSNQTATTRVDIGRSGATPIALGGDLSVNVGAGATLSFDNLLAADSPVTLTKTGGGDLVLNNLNGFTSSGTPIAGTTFTANGSIGAITASGGAVKIYDGNHLAATGATVTLNDGATFTIGLLNTSGFRARLTTVINADTTLYQGHIFSNAGGSSYYGGNLVLNGDLTVTLARDASITDGAFRFWFDQITLNGNTTFNVNASTLFSNGDGILGGAGRSLTKTGSALLDVMKSTITGGYFLKEGTLTLRAGADNNQTVTFTPDAVSGAMLTLYSATTNLGGLVSSSSDVIVENDYRSSYIATNPQPSQILRVLTLNTTAGQTYDFAGVIRDGYNATQTVNLGGGDITGFVLPVALVKTGAGTQILSGVNTYSGATTVNAGNLIVNGSILNSAVTVNGGLLGGSGRLGTVTIANGGTLSPGNSPGTLTIDTLTLAAGSTTLMEIGATSDQIVVNDITFGGTLTLNFTSTLTGDLLLFNIAGTQTGDFSTVNITGVYGDGSLSNEGAGQWDLDLGGGEKLSLNLASGLVAIAPIPEPTATAALLGAMAVFTLWLRRRR
ncbi:MAG: autotransporter-associated beta strand repeat-containing protein [Opitutaceae bacterium]|jgi:autotransporter-associated beta strand protein|nr:autotransporter-associated beta strand repeat-containing protein [Opitutaceae bacterium]